MEREATAQAFWQLFFQTRAPTGDLLLALPLVFLQSHICLKVADDPQNGCLSCSLSLSVYVFLCSLSVFLCSFSVCFSVLCVCVCSCVVYTCACTCFVGAFVYICTCGDQRLMSGIFFCLSPAYFWRRIFHRTWGSPFQPDWLSSDPLGCLSGLTEHRVAGSGHDT